jgi:hypothetical protein
MAVGARAVSLPSFTMEQFLPKSVKVLMFAFNEK